MHFCLCLQKTNARLIGVIHKIQPDNYIKLEYCIFVNFRENIIFANSVKRHIRDVENSLLGHDLPISVNDRVISPFREDFIFTKLPLANFRIYSTVGLT